MKIKFIILWILGVLSTISALPYIFALQHDIIAKAPVSPTIIGIVIVAQTAVLLAITIFFGLKLSQSINLPVVIFLETNNEIKLKIKQIIQLSIPLGILTGIIIKVGDFFFLKYIPEIVAVAEKISFWKTLSASLYGGVVEEILLRLFLVSLFAWILSKIMRSKNVIDNATIMWTAIVASAIIFGLGHLPATATITALTPIVITRAIILNGIGGLVFGWLYWKKGLEYSIVAHFTTDVTLLTILPLLLK